jgi:hypothetical protein
MQGLCPHVFMNFVEPIRDRKKISQIKNLLRGQRRYRDLLLFVLGINTAFRCSAPLKRTSPGFVFTVRSGSVSKMGSSPAIFKIREFHAGNMTLNAYYCNEILCL